MFIIICQDIIEKALDSNDIDHLIAVDTLRKILLCVKWRKHIVFAPDLEEEDILKFDGILTREELRLLNHVYSRRQNSNSLKDKLSIIVQITFKKDTKQDSQIIYLNPKTNKDFELYEETHFIVENILDSEFYKRVICNYFQRKNLVRSDFFDTTFYPVQGGGITVSDVLSFEITLGQHFCFVISDSDRKYGGTQMKGEGETAKGIRTVVEQSKKVNNNHMPFHINYYIMSRVREIENLIPLGIIALYSNKQQKQFLEEQKNCLAFFDMKVGMEYKILFNDEIYSWWRTMLPDEIDWNQIDRLKDSSSTQIEFEAKVKGIQKFVEGWGNSILKKILYPTTKKNRDSLYKLFEIKDGDLTENQKEEWNSIGKHVFSWCCCFTNPPR